VEDDVGWSVSSRRPTCPILVLLLVHLFIRSFFCSFLLLCVRSFICSIYLLSSLFLAVHVLVIIRIDGDDDDDSVQSVHLL